jgi:hypothetical protein
MLRLGLPSDDIPIDSWLARLREAGERDLRSARQMALLRLVWQEAYLTREGLIARVEALLGRGCFGPSPRATFYRDIAAVRRTLIKGGHRLVFSRQLSGKGYYVQGRPLLDERLRHLISGAVAEVDPQQIAIYRRLGPAQRMWQLAHLSDWLRQTNQRRLQRKGSA